MASLSNAGGFSKEQTEIFCYGIRLSPEQAKLVAGKTPRFYESGGQKLFDVRIEGHSTEELMLYVVFE